MLYKICCVGVRGGTFGSITKYRCGLCNEDALRLRTVRGPPCALQALPSRGLGSPGHLKLQISATFSQLSIVEDIANVDFDGPPVQQFWIHSYYSKNPPNVVVWFSRFSPYPTRAQIMVARTGINLW